MQIRPPILKKSVQLKKAGMKGMIRGKLELYDDALVLRLRANFVKIQTATTLPPTFPEDGIPERVDFSEINTITAKPVKRLFSRNVEIELQTKSHDAWTIRASSHLGEIIIIAYRRWRKSAGL